MSIFVVFGVTHDTTSSDYEDDAGRKEKEEGISRDPHSGNGVESGTGFGEW